MPNPPTAPNPAGVVPEDAPRESITIRPSARDWSGMIRHNQSSDATRFRRELGLPAERPLIMTGHQAEFWHPGILAKYLAADAAAEQVGADVAWLVVDQDRPDAVSVRYPVEASDGRLVAQSGSITAGAGGMRLDDSSIAAVKSAPFVRSGLEDITTAASRHASEPTLARQVAAALADLMRPLLRHRPRAPTIFATDLCKATLFQELVDRMAQDPDRCTSAYNAAVARHASSGMRPLLADDIQDRFELPLWWLPPGGPRQHVYAEMIGQVPASQLAPKALFMTGLLRLAGCDLFIHGTGGGGAEGDQSHVGYDLVTEEWLATWLGLAPSSLAPISVVTATRLLPLLAAEPPSPAAVARARWVDHSARHAPYLLRDAYFDDAKRVLVGQIATASPADRSRLFRQMHVVLTQYRQAHDADLRGLQANAESLASRAGNGAVLHDRTWPFPLYPKEVLSGLRDDIAAAFGSR